MSGVLSGLVIAAVAAWIWHMYGRLWRHSLGVSAAGALDEAAAMGLRVRPARGRAAWIASGTLDGISVTIAWRGGVRGERTLIDIGGLKRAMPLIGTGTAFRDALAGTEE